MNTKLLAALAGATVLAAIPAAASARTSFSVTVGTGYPGYYDPYSGYGYSPYGSNGYETYYGSTYGSYGYENQRYGWQTRQRLEQQRRWEQQRYLRQRQWQEQQRWHHHDRDDDDD